MTDTLAAWRDAHAADRCACGHPRRDHYRADGAQSLCFHPSCLRVRGPFGDPERLRSHPFALDVTTGGESC